MSSRQLGVGVLWIGSVVLAVFLSQPSEPTRSAHDMPVTPVAREVRPLPGATTSSQSVSLDALRQVIREEVAAQRDAEATEAAAPTIEPAPERVAEAHAIVRDVIDAGRWTNASRARLRARMSDLPRAELDQVLTELFAALNAGSVRVEVDGPLL